jgi:hypothetical protein
MGYYGKLDGPGQAAQIAFSRYPRRVGIMCPRRKGRTAVRAQNALVPTPSERDHVAITGSLVPAGGPRPARAGRRSTGALSPVDVQPHLFELARVLGNKRNANRPPDSGDRPSVGHAT